MQAEAIRFVQVLAGWDHEAFVGAACLNAAAVLYVAGRAADLDDGLVQARRAVANGLAIGKLEEWVTVQAAEEARRAAGESRLAALEARPAWPPAEARN